ncbi:hypothetical protein DICPUDRAFT_23706, partial [Dictyostelium purpureum]
KKAIHDIVKGYKENRIMEVFDLYYHEEVVTYNNGDSTGRIGKAQNRTMRQEFASRITVTEIGILKLICDGDNSCYEIFIEYTTNEGEKVRRSKWLFQEWKNGQIIKEQYH